MLAESLLKHGEKDAEVIKNEIKKNLLVDPVISVDYISIVCLNDLKEVSGEVCSPALVSVAVYIGGVRLIDNIFYE